MEKGPEGPAHPLLPLRMCHNVSVPCRMTGEHGDLGMGAISRMQVVVRCEHVSHLDLCTLERQSLCESHRQRRWLTCWSYLGLLVNALGWGLAQLPHIIERNPLCI